MSWQTYLNPLGMGLTLTLGVVLIAVALQLVGSALRWRLPGLRLTAAGILLLALGSCGLTVSSWLPPQGLAAVQCLMVSGLACIWVGFVRLQVRSGSRWVLAWWGVGCLVALVLGVVWPLPMLRTALLAAWEGLAAASIAWLAACEERPSLRRGALLVAGGMAVAATFFAVRAAAVVWTQRVPAPFAEASFFNAGLAISGGGALLTMVTGLIFMTTGDLQARLRQESLRDPLTGLSNRRGLRAWLDAQPADSLIAAAILDVDRFKSVNDRWGHERGDRLLQHIGARLVGTVNARRLAVRLGGEEFALVEVRPRPVLPDLTVPGGATDAVHLWAHRRQELLGDLSDTVDALRVQLAQDTELLHLTISAGVACGDLGDLDRVLRTADRRLYAAKMSGRNRVVCEDSRTHVGLHNV